MIDVQDAYLKNVQANYRYYCYHVNNPIKSKPDWIPSKLHVYLCNVVDEFINRETESPVEILLINTPPQHGKSRTITETLPSYFLCKYPDKSVIEISYGDDLAERFGKSNLEKVKEFGGLFGVSVDPKKSTSKEFQIAGHRGRMISRGIGSALTGYSGDLIVIDDPIKNREEADSENRREFIWNEFLNSIMSRCQAHSKVVIIMTRWHEDDLAGRIIDDPNLSELLTVINLPCEAEENDALGRQIGDALCPEIGKDNEWLKRFKATYMSDNGLRAWNALYQGRPTAKEGNMLKREWWQYYQRQEFDEGRLRMDKMILTVDATFKDNLKNDYVAMGVWGKSGVRLYMIDMINEHLDFAGTIRRIRTLKLLYPQITDILIEDKANGSAIIQVLKEQISGIIPVQADVSKEARVNAVSFLIEAGNVYVPKDKAITWEFIDQCSSFPNGKHDDMVDAMSMGVSRLAFTRTYRQKFNRMSDTFNFFSLKKGKKPSATGEGDRINVI